MTTETDIANQALDILKEAPISSLDDPRPVARWLKRNFAVTRDSVLSAADWNFALKRASLTAESAAPGFGWSYSYVLPSDCIRLIPLTLDGYSEGPPLLHEVENRRILTDQPAPLKIRYIYRNETYSQYSATFQEAMSAKLAMKMAHWVTGKTSYAQIAQRLYQDAINNAWLTDAIEGSTPRAADQEWIRAR